MKSSSCLLSALLIIAVVDVSKALPIVETQDKKESSPLSLELPEQHLQKRDINISLCLDMLYIMAFTSQGGGSNHFHEVEIVLSSYEVRHIVLPDLPIDEMQNSKGDLWKIPLTDFHFTDSCITKDEIISIAIKERGNDGWGIDSIVTFLKAGDSYQLSSVDIDVFQGVDGDGSVENLKFNLSLSI